MAQPPDTSNTEHSLSAPGLNLELQVDPSVRFTVKVSVKNTRDTVSSERPAVMSNQSIAATPTCSTSTLPRESGGHEVPHQDAAVSVPEDLVGVEEATSQAGLSSCTQERARRPSVHSDRSYHGRLWSSEFIRHPEVVSFLNMFPRTPSPILSPPPCGSEAPASPSSPRPGPAPSPARPSQALPTAQETAQVSDSDTESEHDPIQDAYELGYYDGRVEGRNDTLRLYEGLLVQLVRRRGPAQPPRARQSDCGDGDTTLMEDGDDADGYESPPSYMPIPSVKTGCKLTPKTRKRIALELPPRERIERAVKRYKAERDL